MSRNKMKNLINYEIKELITIAISKLNEDGKEQNDEE